MTTLEEITRCKDANWAFWSQHARLCLACYKSTGCKLEKAGFRSNMRNRRNRTFLDVKATS